MKTLLIIGGSSTAIEIRECADLFYHDKFEHIYNVIGDTETSSLPNVIHDCDIDKFIVENDIAFIIGFTNQKLRRLFNDKLSQCTPVSIVHPTAVVSPSANIGEGTYVGATAVVSSNAVIGNGCIINIGASIGHDAILGDNCVINPGARISGNCSVGSRTLIGANVFVFQGKSIGSDCAIDALTYIDRNIDEKKLCTGNTGALKIFKNILR